MTFAGRCPVDFKDKGGSKTSIKDSFSVVMRPLYVCISLGYAVPCPLCPRVGLQFPNTHSHCGPFGCSDALCWLGCVRSVGGRP